MSPQLHFHGDWLIILRTFFTEGDIGTTLYEWHSLISSKKLDFGTYHEKVLTLEKRISDNFNEDEPCFVSGHETIYYKVLSFQYKCLKETRLFKGILLLRYILCSAWEKRQQTCICPIHRNIVQVWVMCLIHLILFAIIFGYGRKQFKAMLDSSSSG